MTYFLFQHSGVNIMLWNFEMAMLHAQSHHSIQSSVTGRPLSILSNDSHILTYSSSISRTKHPWKLSSSYISTLIFTISLICNTSCYISLRGYFSKLNLSNQSQKPIIWLQGILRASQDWSRFNSLSRSCNHNKNLLHFSKVFAAPCQVKAQEVTHFLCAKYTFLHFPFRHAALYC